MMARRVSLSLYVCAREKYRACVKRRTLMPMAQNLYYNEI